jgi:hypothetical protein
VGHGHQLLAAETQHQQQHQYQAWCQAQDRIVEDHVPELKKDARGNFVNVEAAVALQHKVLNLLRSGGASDAEIKSAWQNGTLSSAAAQLTLIKAVKFDEMTAAAKRVRAAPLPPVQRPGTRQGGQSSSAVDDAQKAFNANPTQRNGQRLLIAKRSAERG